MSDQMYYMQIEMNDLSKPDYEIAISLGADTLGVFQYLNIISIGCDNFIISERIMKLQLRKFNLTLESDLFKTMIEEGLIKVHEQGYYLPFAINKMNNSYSKQFIGFFNRLKQEFFKQNQGTVWSKIISKTRHNELNRILEDPIFLTLLPPPTGYPTSPPIDPPTANRIEENKSIIEDYKKSSINTYSKDASNLTPLRATVDALTERKLKAIEWCRENVKGFMPAHEDAIMYLDENQMQFITTTEAEKLLPFLINNKKMKTK